MLPTLTDKAAEFIGDTYGPECVRDLVDYFTDSRPVVYTIVRDVSRSGMTRWVDPLIMLNGEPFYLRHMCEELLNLKYDARKDGLKVEGADMDMAWHLVYSLSAALYGYREGTLEDSTRTGAYRLQHRHL